VEYSGRTRHGTGLRGGRVAPDAPDRRAAPMARLGSDAHPWNLGAAQPPSRGAPGRPRLARPHGSILHATTVVCPNAAIDANAPPACVWVVASEDLHEDARDDVTTATTVTTAATGGARSVTQDP